MKEKGALAGAVLGFFLGDDVLPRLLTEAPHIPQSPEGAAYIEFASRLGIPILLGFIGILAGEQADRRMHLGKFL